MPAKHAIPLMCFPNSKTTQTFTIIQDLVIYSECAVEVRSSSEYHTYPNSIKVTYENPDHYKWPFSSINV